MRRSNGGIIGPDNVTTGGPFGSASGVFKLSEATNLIKEGKWPTPGPANTVPNSARFQTASLKRSAGSKTNATQATISMWFKRSELADCVLMQSYVDGGNRSYIKILGDIFYFFDSSGGTTNNYWTSTFVLRDVSAWYHLHVNIDTGNGTAANRLIVHLNGVNQPVANFTNTASYGSGVTSNWQVASGTNQFTIGANESVNDQYFGGYMSEVVYLDGQVVAYDSFGEFDEDSGIWKPIDGLANLTPGNTGFYLDFGDSAALGADVIGSNDFTATGLTSIDQTIDTPTNNFATMNPLASQSGSSSSSSAFTFSNGNLSVSNLTSETGIANLGVSTGKWFWEVKVITDQAGLAIGACNDGQNLDDELGYQSGSSQANAKVFGYYGDNGNKFTTMGDGSQMSAYGSAIAVNNIVGVAMNLDDNEVTFYLNGSSQGTFSITALGSGEVYFPAVGNYSVATIATDFNFGNPPYAISSGNTDGNGFGNFEYAVPTGFLSLCTNNLNTV